MGRPWRDEAVVEVFRLDAVAGGWRIAWARRARRSSSSRSLVMGYPGPHIGHSTYRVGSYVQPQWGQRVRVDHTLPSWVKIVGADQIVTAPEWMRRLAAALDMWKAWEGTSWSFTVGI